MTIVGKVDSRLTLEASLGAAFLGLLTFCSFISFIYLRSNAASSLNSAFKSSFPSSYDVSILNFNGGRFPFDRRYDTSIWLSSL